MRTIERGKHEEECEGGRCLKGHKLIPRCGNKRKLMYLLCSEELSSFLSAGDLCTSAEDEVLFKSKQALSLSLHIYSIR